MALDEQLDERKVKILKAVIKNYLETGEPVGSRTISKFTDMKLSSATIRNEMADLEELGYIVQPHTSAGRIPTDKGYRFYVDDMMSEKEKNITDDVMLHFFTEDFKNESVAVREYIDFIPVSPKNGSKKMYNLFDTLLHMFLTPEPGTTYSIKMILLQIFCLLNDRSRYKNVPVRIGTETESLLFLKITECMQETNGRISRSGLQQHLHYNGAYLNRIVMKFTGLSIFGYGMTFCMQQAGALLTSSHTDISLIAESLGFQNRTHFYKKFEDTYGMTPGEYRKLHSSL